MMSALDTGVWNQVVLRVRMLIPAPPERPQGGGRRRVPDELILAALRWRLVLGASWETIEVILEHRVSDTTMRARRDEWIEAGVFDRVLAVLMDLYATTIGIDTDNVVIDGSHHPAPCGGAGTGIAPRQKGRLHWKWCLAVDGAGIPLAWTLDSGNRNDYPMLRPTLDATFANRHVETIDTLHLDRGFGYQSLPEKLEGYDITKVNALMRKKPGEGAVALVGFGKRWTVERTHSWFTNYGQLGRNTDRKTEHRHAALCFAVTILLATRIVDHTRQPPEPIR